MHSETYLEWLENRRYRVVRNERTPAKSETVVESGLTLDVARATEKRLQQDYDSTNPDKTTWTKALFLIQLETPAWEPKR